MELWSKEEFEKNLQSKSGAFYLYTPMCGTCQVASKMLSIVNELLPNLCIGKADLNFFPEIATTYEIESVPCLLIFGNGTIKEKIYAFHSVPFIYEKLKQKTTSI